VLSDRRTMERLLHLGQGIAEQSTSWGDRRADRELPGSTVVATSSSGILSGLRAFECSSEAEREDCMVDETPNACGET